MITKQTKAFIDLFETILKENTYYEYLGKVYKKYGREFASCLYWVFDDRQPISVYGFLDSIENQVRNDFADTKRPRIESIRHHIRDVITDLDKQGDWRD